MVKEELNLSQITDFSNNWKVVLFNDDTTHEVFVLGVLTSIFDYDMYSAFEKMKAIEKSGSGVVGIYPKKLAEVRKNKAMAIAKEAGFNDFKVELEEDK